MESRDTFIFYRSIFEAGKVLSDKDRLKFYDAIIEFSLEFNEPTLTGIPAGMFALVRPTLDKSNKGYMAGSKNKPRKYPPRVPTDNKDKDKDKDIEEEERWNFINEIKSKYSGIKFTVDKTEYYFHEDGFLKTWNGNSKLTTSKAMTLYKRMNKNRNAIMAHLQANKVDA